jgi:hypothetical protein
MSFLEQFFKESSIRGRAASADSEEGEIEDNRAPSVLSSSNKSALDLSSPVKSGPSHHLSPLRPEQQPSQTDGGNNGGSPFGQRSMDRSNGHIMQVLAQINFFKSPAQIENFLFFFLDGPQGSGMVDMSQNQYMSIADVNAVAADAQLVSSVAAVQQQRRIDAAAALFAAEEHIVAALQIAPVPGPLLLVAAQVQSLHVAHGRPQPAGRRMRSLRLYLTSTARKKTRRSNRCPLTRQSGR